MTAHNDLQRFIAAQERDYATALSEIKRGKKASHWMWYIFPQLDGLGYSQMAKHYALHDEAEAIAYLQHPVLGSRLIEISEALVHVPGSNATQVMGTPDDLKLKSCMTLFAALPNTDAVFQQVLHKFYKGATDSKTLQLLGK